ncbi:MAG: hypothetical protein IT355_19330 [Gemmatimonadaceae bacterium]|nr:hypothetical protein [Gemmatimonadaceae bacterium]
MFDEADRLATAIGMSRSQLYATALAEYLAKHRDSDVTDALNRVYADPPPHDAGVQAAARTALRRSEWT